VKLIVGLGNPGIEYQFTRHNLGFLAVDRLAERWGVKVASRRCRALTGRARVGEQEVVLAKPETFMNLSGMAVRELVRELGAAPQRDLMVIYDELDLPLGKLRIRQRGRSAGHNGLESIMDALGTEEFLRIRIGIGPSHPVKDGTGYVLRPFRRSEIPAVDASLDRVTEAVELILREGAAVAMNRFNRRPQAEAEEEQAKS